MGLRRLRGGKDCNGVMDGIGPETITTNEQPRAAGTEAQDEDTLKISSASTRAVIHDVHIILLGFDRPSICPYRVRAPVSTISSAEKTENENTVPCITACAGCSRRRTAENLKNPVPVHCGVVTVYAYVKRKSSERADVEEIA